MFHYKNEKRMFKGTSDKIVKKLDVLAEKNIGFSTLKQWIMKNDKINAEYKWKQMGN